MITDKIYVRGEDDRISQLCDSIDSQKEYHVAGWKRLRRNLFLISLDQVGKNTFMGPDYILKNIIKSCGYVIS